jgi:pimeloyl-ACP methyl ester carboxylesterase
LRRRSVLAISGAAALVVAALGPRVRVEERWVEPDLGEDVDAYLAAAEAEVADVRAGDGRAIVWVDPESRGRTPLSLVYLHGFSADRHELEPVVSQLASKLGANVYFARLTGHGRDGSAMSEASVEDWFDDTAEAVAIGAAIGEQVVLIGTSTGGTLATWAASQEEAQSRVGAVVLVSPNFHPADRRASRVLLYPWGGVLARMIVGGERCFKAENDRQERHWTTCYPTSALLPMMALVEHVRTMNLAAVTARTLVIFDPGDAVVDPEETERVIAAMSGTRPVVSIYEGTGDPSRHVLAGDILSPESNDGIGRLMFNFLVLR